MHKCHGYIFCKIPFPAWSSLSDYLSTRCLPATVVLLLSEGNWVVSDTNTGLPLISFNWLAIITEKNARTAANSCWFSQGSVLWPLTLLFGLLVPIYQRSYNKTMRASSYNYNRFTTADNMLYFPVQTNSLLLIYLLFIHISGKFSLK